MGGGGGEKEGGGRGGKALAEILKGGRLAEDLRRGED